MARIAVLSTTQELFLHHSSDTADADWFSYRLNDDGKLEFGRRDGPPASIAIESKEEVNAIYGSFKLLRGYYIAVVSKSTRICDGPNGSTIHRVDGMRWLPVAACSVRPALSTAEQRDEALYLSLLSRISATRSFYFAVGGAYDITSTLQINDAVASAAAGLSVFATPAPLAMLHSADGSGSVAASSPVSSGSTPPVAPCVGTYVPPPPSETTAAAAAPLWRTADPRFFWNRGRVHELVEGAGASFVTPFINGFVGAATVHDVDLLALARKASDGVAANEGAASDMTLLLISRRGVTRQGMRFTVRGADAEGNVANFAETEQILTMPGGRAASSYTQARGSIPLLWEQLPTLKYTPRASLSPNTAGSALAFDRHISSMLRHYAGSVLAVCLIDKKGDQLTLGTAFANAAQKLLHADASGVTAAESAALVGGATTSSDTESSSSSLTGAPSSPVAAAADGLSFTWFDFHAECRKMKWGNLSKLMDAVESRLTAQGYYARGSNGRVIRIQQGVVRTNCMDNLDRTNVVQSLFARRAALEAVPGAWAATRAAGTSVLTSSFPGFEAAFNGLWADNADALSVLYSGTGALKTDFTRTGRRTMSGALSDGVNSVVRFVLNNLSDGRTQDAWDLFTGRYIPHREAVVHVKGVDGVASAARSQKRSPVVDHIEELTPAAFLGWIAGGLLVLTLFFAHTLTDDERPWTDRFARGAVVATVAFAGLAYMLVAKGKPAELGRYLVSKPHFVKTLSHAARRSGASAGAGGSQGAAQASGGHDGPSGDRALKKAA